MPRSCDTIRRAKPRNAADTRSRIFVGCASLMTSRALKMRSPATASPPWPSSRMVAMFATMPFGLTRCRMALFATRVVSKIGIVTTTVVGVLTAIVAGFADRAPTVGAAAETNGTRTTAKTAKAASDALIVMGPLACGDGRSAKSSAHAHEERLGGEEAEHARNDQGERCRLGHGRGHDGRKRQIVE